MGNLFHKKFVVSITFTQNLLRKLLSISIDWFIITIIYHSYSTGLFSLYIYVTTYSITIPHFSQKFCSFVEINSLLAFAQKICIEHLFLVFTYKSYT